MRPIDREKVIRGLENIVSDMQEEIDEWRDYSDSELSHGLTCDCEWWYNTAQMLKDAIAMLKAQEPVEPTIDTHWETPSVYDDDVKVTENKCGACGAEIDKWDKYCRVCGRAVKWE